MTHVIISTWTDILLALAIIVLSISIIKIGRRRHRPLTVKITEHGDGTRHSFRIYIVDRLGNQVNMNDQRLTALEAFKKTKEEHDA